MSSTQDVLDELRDFLKSSPLSLRSPIGLQLDIQEEDRLIGPYFVVRTTSWDFSSERTDLHDAFSMLLALFLRVCTGVSTDLWDVAHPVTRIDTELYARYVTIAQPSGPYYPINQAGATAVKELHVDLYMFFRWFTEACEWICDDGHEPVESSDYQQATEWAGRIAGALGGRVGDQCQWMARENPTWKHFRSIRPYVSVLQSLSLVQSIREWIVAAGTGQVVRDSQRILIVSDTAKHSYSRRDETLARRIFRACGDAADGNGMVVVPIENRVFVIGDSHIVAFYRDCGRRRFEKDRNRIRARYRALSGTLFPVSRFEWKTPIDDNEFELMIQALLRKEQGVHRVRRASSSSRDRDKGRDLIAEWTTSPLPGEKVPANSPPFVLRRVVVQCKAESGAVSKSRVTDIRDVVEDAEASGYFLAVASSLTSGLFEHLDRMRASGKLWIDWWTRTEIEERLAEHDDIAAQFRHLVEAVHA